MPTSSSPSASRMPRTPAALRPIDRTSLSRKRMHWPRRDARKISRQPSVYTTPISSSSSARLIALRPTFRTFRKSSIGVFFTTPRFVAMKRYASARSLGSGITAVTFSPGRSCRRLTVAVPRACREASGISYAFSWYTRPLFVKKNSFVWVFVMKRSAT